MMSQRVDAVHEVRDGCICLVRPGLRGRVTALTSDAIPALVHACLRQRISSREPTGYGLVHVVPGPLAGWSHAVEYTIDFAGEDMVIMPAVVLGLRAGENLYVTEDHAWSGKYVPAFARRYPFVFSGREGAPGGTGLPDEEQRDTTSEANQPEDRPEVGAVCEVRTDISDSCSHEGQRQGVDHGLRSTHVLGNQDTRDEDGQGLEAVRLCGVCPGLPALKTRQPLAGIVIVEPAFSTWFAEALPLRDARARDGQEAGKQDAGIGDGHSSGREGSVAIVGRCVSDAGERRLTFELTGTV